MHLILCAIFLLAVALTQSGFVLHGGGSTGASPTGILLPLTGSSLVTTNSGTLTFSNTQNRVGWNVLKNGSDFHISATAICTATLVSGTLTCQAGATNVYLKYNTLLPSPWPAAECLADTWAATTTLTAPTGSFSNTAGTWSWGTQFGTTGYYHVLLNGVAQDTLPSVIQNGANQMVLGNDGAVYVRGPGAANRPSSYFVYYPASSGFVSWATGGPTNQANGQLRKAVQCPVGL